MLKGERVSLRALEPADAEALYQWHLDHEFSVLDGVIYPASRTAWQEFVARRVTPSFEDVFLGIEIEPAELIGYISLKRTRPEERNADFGIAIRKGNWSQAYGRDATMTILRFAFNEMNLHRVTLTVLDYNERAQRMYAACGFREEGRLRESKYRDGRYVDKIVMGILKSEFCQTNSG
jgi:RimJ/RimL family protein N-acetyltransferase